MHALSIVLPVLLSGLAATENWPEYRGPTADGRAGARGLPVRWSETENIRWKTAIHDRGWSSPVIWGRQIWLTTALANGTELFAVCVDRDSGKIIHDLRVFEVEKPAFRHPFNSYASPTPAIEAGRVYVHFGSAGTACLDTSSGKIIWERRDLLCDHFRGPGSSPILVDNLLILTFDGFDVQYLVALDKITGKTVWKKNRETAFPSADGDFRKAYSTPIIIDVGGKPQLICPAAEATMAYEPGTGREIWRVVHGGMNAASRPLWNRSRLFLTTGDGGKGLLAVRPAASPATVDWVFSKGVPTRASLLLIDDLLYMVSNVGVLSSVNAGTGEREEQVRLGGPFTASPVYADGRMYFPNEDGATYVVEPGRPVKVIATNHLDQGCMASPAVSGRVLFLRTKTHLYAIEVGGRQP